MKKVITICLLVVTLLVGGMTMDAKTTKKKSSKTSSSASWNGDIPSAAIILSADKYKSQFKNKGYDTSFSPSKPGVFEMEWCGTTGGPQINITVYDSAKLKWLYNNIKTYIRNHKSVSKSIVDTDNNTIYWFFPNK